MGKLLLLLVVGASLVACGKSDEGDAASTTPASSPAPAVNANPSNQASVPGGGSLASPQSSAPGGGK